MKKKFDILVLEPKSIHWTTVEPYLRNLDKRIVLFAPEKSIEISFNSNPKIYFLHFSILNFLKLFLFDFETVVVADRVFQLKFLKNSIGEYFKETLYLLIRFFFFFLKLRHKKIYITTHFVNGFKYHSPYTLLQKVDRLLWRKLLGRSKGFFVFSTLVKKELEKETDKEVYFAPNATFNLKESQRDKRNRITKVIIPGRVDLRRRDYNWITGLEKFDNLDINFLGRPYDKNSFLSAIKIEEKGYAQNFLNSDHFIPTDKFNEEIENCDILFAPIKKLKNSQRAIDRNLGALFDAIRYGKPLILPSHQPIPDEIKGSAIIYDDTESLNELLNKLSDKEYLEGIKNKAIENSKSFNKNFEEFWGLFN